MFELFVVTAPIFLLIGAGYAAVAFRLLSPEDVGGLGRYVIRFALPALIVTAVSQRSLSEGSDLVYLLCYGAGSLVAFLVTLSVMLGLRRHPLPQASILALGTAASNSGFIGYPLLVLVLGQVAAVAMSLNMLVENLMMLPLALALSEVGRQEGARPGVLMRNLVSRLARNPIVIAILLGLVLSLTGLALPAPLGKALSMTAAASAPVALFVIGGTLYGLGRRAIGADVAIIVAGKLVMHPLLVAGALGLFGGAVPPELVTAAILMASVPMLSVYPIFGAAVGLGRLCAAAMLLATLAAFFTLPLALALVGHAAP
ncbi:AEC family transporter [Aurantimonas sp. MSK8Z-1]|uniref:AEC family transporter n=1 Tax=Mangrovibrevibacter kandeliae TaxID=2968473 RepID=UPI002118CDF7|nr:AEC family transporter [Aurantimonas sp. MSK8Z-1]MCW4114105.1 AEC family transporter [Aurantimonas sp. MSK8Z-1]